MQHPLAFQKKKESYGDGNNELDSKTMTRVRERVYDLNLASHEQLPYNPLVDKALADFFNIKTVREHLVKQNLISEDGIIYDFRTVRGKQAELDRGDRERQHQQVRDNADLEVHIATLVRERLESYKKAHGPEARHVLQTVVVGVNDHITKMINSQFPNKSNVTEAYIGTGTRPATASECRPSTSPSRRPVSAVSYAQRTKEYKGTGPRPWRPSSLHPDYVAISESKAFRQRPATARPQSENNSEYGFTKKNGQQRSVIERARAIYGQRPKTAAAGVSSNRKHATKQTADNNARSRFNRPKTAKTRSKATLEVSNSQEQIDHDSDFDFAPANKEDLLEAEKDSFSPTNSTRFDESSFTDDAKATQITYPLSTNEKHAKDKSISKLAESVKNSFSKLHIGNSQSHVQVPAK